MTMQKSFKRLVRARMEKTGESYTAARARILAADPGQKATEGPALSVSEEVITERTGRGWEEWFYRPGLVGRARGPAARGVRLGGARVRPGPLVARRR